MNYTTKIAGANVFEAARNLGKSLDDLRNVEDVSYDGTTGVVNFTTGKIGDGVLQAAQRLGKSLNDERLRVNTIRAEIDTTPINALANASEVIGAGIT